MSISISPSTKNVLADYIMWSIKFLMEVNAKAIHFHQDILLLPTPDTLPNGEGSFFDLQVSFAVDTAKLTCKRF
jgi:hypothetical protein